MLLRLVFRSLYDAEVNECLLLLRRESLRLPFGVLRFPHHDAFAEKLHVSLERFAT